MGRHCDRCLLDAASAILSVGVCLCSCVGVTDPALCQRGWSHCSHDLLRRGNRPIRLFLRSAAQSFNSVAFSQRTETNWPDITINRFYFLRRQFELRSALFEAYKILRTLLDSAKLSHNHPILYSVVAIQHALWNAMVDVFCIYKYVARNLRFKFCTRQYILCNVLWQINK